MSAVPAVRSGATGAFRIWVPIHVARGSHVTQGSKNTFVRDDGKVSVVEFHAEDLEVFRADVRAAVIEARGYRAAPLEGPLRLGVIVLVPSYGNTPKNKLTFPIKRGTGDDAKFLRAVEDALEQAGVCHDDAQFLRETIEKDWANRDPKGRPCPPGVLIEVGPWEPDVLPRDRVAAVLAASRR